MGHNVALLATRPVRSYLAAGDAQQDLEECRATGRSMATAWIVAKPHYMFGSMVLGGVIGYLIGRK